MQGLPIRRIIIYMLIGCGAVIITAILFWVWTHGRLVIDMPEDAHRVTIRQQLTREDDTQEEELTGGETLSRILRSGKYEVTVFTEDEQKASSYFVEIPRFLGVVHKEASLVNQAERQKVGRGGLPCQAFVGDELYSYTCSGASSISPVTQLSLSQPFDVNTIDIPDILSVQSYGDGALVLHMLTYQDEELVLPKLSYIENGKIVSTIDLPEALNLPATGSINYQLAVDDDTFLISGSFGELAYYFDSFDSEPRRLDLDLDVSPFSLEHLVSAITLDDSTITIASGIPAQGHGTSDDGADRAASIFIHSFAIEETTVPTHRSTVENTFLSDASLCGDGYLCVIDESVLKLYELENESATHITSISDIGTQIAPVSDTQFAYQQGDGIFLFDIPQQESRQIYRSPNFRLSRILPSSEGLLVTAFPEKEGSDSSFDLYTFVLGNDIAETNNFIDQKLPYAPLSLDGAVLRSDYFRDTIAIQVALDSWESPVRVSGGGANNFTYDQEEFEEKRERILRQLAEDGFTPDDYTIRIEP